MGTRKGKKTRIAKLDVHHGVHSRQKKGRKEEMETDVKIRSASRETLVGRTTAEN